MRVELDAFSGRPNPVWELTEAQSLELLTRLRNLPPGVGIGREGLGYRGLIVTADHSEVGGFDRIVISEGTVVGARGTREERFRDADRALERWLFHTASRHLEPDLYSMIAQELDR